MSFTISSGADTYTLRNASFGDSRRFDDQRTLSRNRSGEPKISVDPEWGNFYTYTWPFTELKATEKDNLETILIAHPGELFTITDHDKTVIGYIMESEIHFTEGFTDRWDCEITLLSITTPDDEPYLLLEDSTYLLLEDDQRTFLESV